MAPPPYSLLLLAVAACTPAAEPGAAGPGGSLRPAHPDRGEDDGSGGDNGGSTDTPGGTDSGGDTDGGGGAPGGAVEPLRFVALGDAGTGDEEQYQVADAVASVCADLGCAFALYLGDNIYSDGVTSVDDDAWEDKFEAPYAALEFPFYAVLGNHDYGGNGGAFEVERAEAQVAYTSRSNKWVMPDTFYTHTQGEVGFVALDTTALDWANTEAQEAWLPGALASLDTRWKIAYGHHPYISNGDHGDANENFGPFFEEHLCGQVDVYFCGHDHDLQWLEPTCGTEFIVSGAAAKLRDLGDGDNPTFFEASTYGFVWVEIDGDTFTGVYFDLDGEELFRRSFTR